MTVVVCHHCSHKHLLEKTRLTHAQGVLEVQEGPPRQWLPGPSPLDQTALCTAQSSLPQLNEDTTPLFIFTVDTLNLILITLIQIK